MSELRNVEKFRFWCHKIIPLVYDESLSYYEFLCKVLAKLNEVIDTIEAMNEHIEEFEQEVRDMVQRYYELMQEDCKAIKDGIAYEWEANKNYAVGDYVWHDKDIIKCKTAHTSGETYDPTKWEVYPVTQTVKDLKSVVSEISADLEILDGTTQAQFRTVNEHITALSENKADMYPEYPTDWVVNSVFPDEPYQNPGETYNKYLLAANVTSDFTYIVVVENADNVGYIGLGDAQGNIIGDPVMLKGVYSSRWLIGKIKPTLQGQVAIYALGDASDTSEFSKATVYKMYPDTVTACGEFGVLPVSVLGSYAVQQIEHLHSTKVGSASIHTIITCTQAEYDAITTPANDTLYVIVG